MRWNVDEYSCCPLGVGPMLGPMAVHEDASGCVLRPNDNGTARYADDMRPAQSCRRARHAFDANTTRASLPGALGLRLAPRVSRVANGALALRRAHRPRLRRCARRVGGRHTVCVRRTSRLVPMTHGLVHERECWPGMLLSQSDAGIIGFAAMATHDKTETDSGTQRARAVAGARPNKRMQLTGRGGLVWRASRANLH
jgi:hypothetical protein